MDPMSVKEASEVLWRRVDGRRVEIWLVLDDSQDGVEAC
mgnify:CR=1 FL=1